MNQVKFLEDILQKFEVYGLPKQTISLQIF